MIKSNWLIKSLIKFSDLIFMQICLIISLFNLEFALSFNLGYNGVQLCSQIYLKFQLDSSIYLKTLLSLLFPSCQYFCCCYYYYYYYYYFIFNYFIFKKKINLEGNLKLSYNTLYNFYFSLVLFAFIVKFKFKQWWQSKELSFRGLGGCLLLRSSNFSLFSYFVFFFLKLLRSYFVKIWFGFLFLWLPFFSALTSL